MAPLSDGAARRTIMARPRTRRGTAEDACDRANRLAKGVIRIAGMVRQVQAMPEGPARRRLMAVVDRMMVDLQRTAR